MPRRELGRKQGLTAIMLGLAAVGGWLLPQSFVPGARPLEALEVSTPSAQEPARRELLAAAAGALLLPSSSWASSWPFPAQEQQQHWPFQEEDEEDPRNIAVFQVQLGGDSSRTHQVRVKLHPEWAPRGVSRFRQLVSIGEMENSAVFHVDEDFAHFGLPAEPTLVPDHMKDDTVRISNKRGTLTFAQPRGKHSRVNQLFFNKDDNAKLDRWGFAPIGEVIEGMDVVDQLYGGYGKRPMVHQIIEAGNKYLESDFPNLSKIKKVEIPM